ncbi:MAG: hypothetical protein IPP69_16190 [Flavobacteriales bacterium]|nr:hypothetical protein [Flavobacteriales bacterium]
MIFLFLASCNSDKKMSDAVSHDFISPHHEASKQLSAAFSNTQEVEDTIPLTSDIAQLAPGSKRHSEYKIFGWHLPSNSKKWKTYNFDLLWGISYFSYSIDPNTGKYRKSENGADAIADWNGTAMLDSAQIHGCKVFLTVTNFTKSDNAKFLLNRSAWDTLLTHVTQLLKNRKASGINIDFENVAAENKNDLSHFITFISTGLKKVNPEYQVSLALYAVDHNQVFDIKLLNQAVDFYTLMSYDYYGRFSHNKAGPVAPLRKSSQWGAHSVTTSVDYYITQGVSSDDLILGIPYYGNEFIVAEDKAPASVAGFKGRPCYSSIHKKRLNNKLTPVVVNECGGEYYSYTEEDQIVQCWYDGSALLSEKFQFVKERNLGGVCIWALGYDWGEPNLWNLISDSLGTSAHVSP